ncbi:hypothetical protein TruAng_005698 [Truncatella angustata]|nr:hypothetical protein TruAng_005698 [Truncatella angustata]
MVSASAERGEETAMSCENHPLYQEQRPNLELTFCGKKKQIETQFHDFHQEAIPDVKSQTDQRKEKKNWEGEALAETEQIKIISNWASFEVQQYPKKPAQAGMSMVHLLAYPIEHIRNGVDLTVDNVGLIDDMIQLFKGAWANETVRNKILRLQLDAVERRAKAIEDEPFGKEANDAALAHYRVLESKVTSGQLKFEDFHFGLHLRPDNSADYLHLHIIAAPYEYRKYSTSEHDKKTKDAIEVRDVIRDDARPMGRVMTGSKSPSITEEGAHQQTVEPSR